METNTQTILKEYLAGTEFRKQIFDILALACETLEPPTLYHLTLKLFYTLKGITERLETGQRSEFVELMHSKMEKHVGKVGDK